MCETSRRLSPIAKKKIETLKRDHDDQIMWYDAELQRVERDRETKIVAVRREYEERLNIQQAELNATRHELRQARDQLRRQESYIEALRSALIHEIAYTGNRLTGDTP